MQYLQFTHVDALTGISVVEQPTCNGPVFPAVEGLTFVWARESQYPTLLPQFFGTCPDTSSTQVPGVLGVFSQTEWEQMRADELLARPDPEVQRVAALWQAAHDYEYAQISGSAIGLLAIGVIQSQPKCLAVQNWIKSIWTEYYIRKAGDSTNCNFDAVGPCPHTVPELMTELGF